MTRLLLVDDDEDNLKLFTIILQNVGFVVDAYSDPVMALAEFKPKYYDLLVFDCRMPNLNGLELYTQIIKIDKSTKVMFLTATHEQLQMSNEELQQDEWDFKIVRKPVTIAKLVEEVDSMLSLEKQGVVM